MFNFFQRKNKEFSSGAGLQADMHSHLIPGIDDGAPDLATSIQLIRALKAMGYTKLITTPHVMQGVYSNTSARIKQGLEEVRNELARQSITMEIEAAAEYFSDLHFEKLVEENDLLSFGKERYVLVEMSFVAPSPNLEKVIFNLQTNGYQPVLAHPERYTYWDITRFTEIKNLGCLLQVNLLSLSGYYGKGVMKAGQHLVQAGLADFLGTDLHHQRHADTLRHYHSSSRELMTYLQKYPFRNKELF